MSQVIFTKFKQLNMIDLDPVLIKQFPEKWSILFEMQQLFVGTQSPLMLFYHFAEQFELV